MADIYHDFPIGKSPEEVFSTLQSTNGLEAWWSLTAAGTPGLGEIIDLNFGPGYMWQAEITAYTPATHIEWTIIDAESDWMNTRIGFHLEGIDSQTQVRFYHVGWPENSDNYRTSSFCWAMYLRILKRYIEYGEFVAYDERLSV